MSEKILKKNKDAPREATSEELRSKHRKELREFLPLDLQVKFEKKGTYKFGGALAKRRKSEVEEDKLFFNILEQKKSIAGDNIGLERLSGEIIENRLGVQKDLDNYIFLYKILDQVSIDLSGSNTLENLVELIKVLGDKGKIGVVISNLVKGGNVNNAVTLAILSNNIGEMEQLFEHADFSDLAYEEGLLAARLNKPDVVNDVIDILRKEERYDQLLDLLVVAGKSDEIKKMIEADVESASKHPDSISYNQSALRGIKSLAKVNPESISDVDVGVCLRNVDYEPALVCEIALSLAKEKPDYAQDIMDKLLAKKNENARYFAKIALAMNDYNSVGFAISVCLALEDSPFIGTANEILSELAKIDLEKAREIADQKFSLEQIRKENYHLLGVNKLKKIVHFFDEPLQRGEAFYLLGNIDEAVKEIDRAEMKVVDRPALFRLALNVGRVDKALEILDWIRKYDVNDHLPSVLVYAKTLRPSNETLRLTKTLDELSLNDKSYALTVTEHLLKQKEDLTELKTEYLPRFEALKSYSQGVNKEIEEGKKWTNPDLFFNKNGGNIATLQTLNLNLGTDLVKSLLSRGLSFAEASIEAYGVALGNGEIKRALSEYIKDKVKSFPPQAFGTLLETASAYLNSNQLDLFISILKENRDLKITQDKLNKELLLIVAKDLGLEVQITSGDLSAWHLKYLPNLLTNQELIKSKIGEDSTELTRYQALLKATFENRFKDFITNIDQEDELGKEVAEHNGKVQNAFEEKGIDWDKWNSFEGQEQFIISTVKKIDREALFKQFFERLNALMETIKESPELTAALKKDLQNINNEKKSLDLSTLYSEDGSWYERLLPKFKKAVELFEKNEREARGAKETFFEWTLTIFEPLEHLKETLKTLSKPESREKTTQKEFLIKKWDRDPRRDLFQGNFTHCCISVGVKEMLPGGGVATFHPDTIVDYLLDQGIQVVEVVDPDTNEPIGQVWLFVTPDKDGKPVMIADNFEINNRYPAGNNVNRGIRDAMFKFLKEYAKACKIEKVDLGEVGTNDVETDDLEVVSLPPIEKLGGYLNDEKYYLEALEDTKAFMIQ
ncbi:MAG: hypothetical protein HY225_00575 [Candidatus Vogelbacteria bacterium]|nr:hypothetical protein [Candidatus Vogelbacteria bacterium]